MKSINTLCLIALLFCQFSCKKDDDSSNCDHESYTESVYQVLDSEVGPVQGIIQNSDNSLITFGEGIIDGSNFNFQLTKLNEELDIIWKNDFGGSANEYSTSFIPTMDNGFLMCGSTNSFGQGSTNMYIVKSNNEGQEEWSKSYGTTNTEIANSVLQLEDESFIVVGSSLFYNPSISIDEYIIKIDKDGNEIWSQTIDSTYQDRAVDIKKTSDNNLVILSTTTSTNGSDLDLVVTKLDYDGNLIWRQNYGASSPSVIYPKLINTSDNQLLIGASSAEGIDLSASDFMVIKINEDGEVQWTNTFGSDGRDVFSSVIETNDNNFLVLGGGPPCNGGRSDIHLSKISTTGDLLWKIAFGGNPYEAANEIFEINNDEFLITGHIEGTSGIQDFDLITFKVDGNGKPK